MHAVGAEVLQRYRSEYAEEQAAAAERNAGDALELHDAQLLRVRLAATLQRYKERKPSLEDLTRHYESELDAVEAELKLLREENGLLATQGVDVIERPAARGSASRRAPTVAEELHQEACDLRPLQMEAAKIARRTMVGEWSLKNGKADAKMTMSRLKAQEQTLEDLRSRHTNAENYLRDLLLTQAQSEEELAAERERVRTLHRDALNMREACYVPATLKKEASFLMKFLDHEGGRLKTDRHLRSVESCRRLYQEVAHAAPNLLPLAGRAKAEMEEEFARYLQLEESHNRALQRLQLGVVRGLQRPQD